MVRRDLLKSKNGLLKDRCSLVDKKGINVWKTDDLQCNIHQKKLPNAPARRFYPLCVLKALNKVIEMLPKSLANYKHLCLS